MKTRTYISLFSSAGVGCYGFKLEGFQCIATNEIVARRLEVQKANSKCKYDSGYILGDITNPEIKNDLFNEVNFWKEQEGIKDVTVIIATPPCQGMSVANHKKKNDDNRRNSLVVESLKIIRKIKPKIFIMENVANFMKTICTDVDGVDKTIEEAIKSNLLNDYEFISKVINFKNYGANSSRTRTVVIGVRKDLSKSFEIANLFPKWRDEKKLIDVIGHLPRLHDFHEFTDDFFHFFRKYSPHMRTWIEKLDQGQSAFENSDKNRVPHRVIDGCVVYNKNKNGNKYTRQNWDKVGPCVHTRNDQLASQNTIHPEDDRVFSIRELMLMMSIPDSFRWFDKSLDEVNEFSKPNKIKWLKKHEINIRQSIGEAVPTQIFKEIAQNINEQLKKVSNEN